MVLKFRFLIINNNIGITTKLSAIYQQYIKLGFNNAIFVVTKISFLFSQAPLWTIPIHVDHAQ